ncbi:MAG: PAS domain-containing protein [Janthinobacterium lividum]
MPDEPTDEPADELADELAGARPALTAAGQVTGELVGQMAALMRDHDWRTTALGAEPGWPSSLVTLVRVMLGARQPMFIAWGEQRTLLYNDAYTPMLGARHPAALGRPFFEVWPEVRQEVGALMDQVFAGQPVQMDDLCLTLHRNGYEEEAHFAFSYTPIPGEAGSGAAAPGSGRPIQGLFCACTETTLQVRAEHEIARAAEQQQQMLQEVPGFMAVLHGPDHVFDYVNDAYVAIAGPRDFLGRSVRQVFPELEGQGFFELLDRVRADDEPFFVRATPIRLSGEAADRFIDLRYQPIHNGAGVVTGIFVSGYDVTEAIRSAGALRRLNDRLEEEVTARADERSRTWQVSTDLLGVANADGYFERTNPAWTTVLGWTEAELAAHPFISLVHPEDRTRTQAAFDQLRAGKPVLRFENRYRTRAGDFRWLGWVAVPEGDRFYCSARDITFDRNQAAQLAERTAERDLLAGIVGETDTLIMACGLDYGILALNRAIADEFERVYGIRPQVGDNLLALLADQPEHQAAVRATWSRGLAGEAITVVEEFGDPARDRPYYEIRFRPLRNERGARIGCYQFVTDVTERLREQAKLADAQEALRQAQKLEAVGQLTGGVAHDFNNLLTVIKSSTDLLKRPNLPEERRTRYVTAISETADRAAKLTGQLLAFARRQALTPVVFDANQAVRGLGDMIGTLTGTRVSLGLDLPDAPCFVNADASQFDTALVNMAVNARDAMGGEGRLSITVRRTGELSGRQPAGELAPQQRPPERRGWVAVAISDSGTGIPAELLERIFEPFFTTKGVGQGTGLGLSQVFGFAKQSGGEVTVDSVVGEGTTFTLYLPGVSAPDAVPEAGLDVPVEDGHGTRVLVVEDNPDVGSFVLLTLSELGYQARLVRDGKAALDELARHPGSHEIMFSDVVMPGMDGITLAREASRRYPGLPVVLTSGYSHVLAQDAGHGFELLHKPYSVEELSRILRRAVSKLRRQGATTG